MTKINSTSIPLCIEGVVPPKSALYTQFRTQCETVSFDLYTANPSAALDCIYLNQGITNRELCTTRVQWWAPGPQGFSFASLSYQFVPEPVTPLLLLAGVVGVGVLRRFRGCLT